MTNEMYISTNNKKQQLTEVLYEAIQKQAEQYAESISEVFSEEWLEEYYNNLFDLDFRNWNIEELVKNIFKVIELVELLEATNAEEVIPENIYGTPFYRAFYTTLYKETKELKASIEELKKKVESESDEKFDPEYDHFSEVYSLVEAYYNKGSYSFYLFGSAVTNLIEKRAEAEYDENVQYFIDSPYNWDLSEIPSRDLFGVVVASRSGMTKNINLYEADDCGIFRRVKEYKVTGTGFFIGDGGETLQAVRDLMFEPSNLKPIINITFEYLGSKTFTVLDSNF